MKVIARLTYTVCLLAGACFAAVPFPEAANPGEELARMLAYLATTGTLTIGQRAEPKTLNPLPRRTRFHASDRASIGDLIDINRSSQQTEPALAKSWKISPDAARLPCNSAKGIRFSAAIPRCGRRGVFVQRLHGRRLSIPHSGTC